MKRMELRVEGEAFKGKRFAVPAGGLRLGRSSSNDIPVRDAELSRNHCLFEPSGEEGIRLTNLASANGTFVNEKRLGAESVELKAGDVIRVGSTFVKVVGEDAGPAEFDLGLGDKTAGKKVGGESRSTADDKNASATSNRKVLNALWAVVAAALGAAIWLILKTPSKPAVPTSEISDEKPTLVAMRYEKVAADSQAIFRYCLTFAPDGTLRVTIDDTKDDRHNDKKKTLAAAATAQLMEMLADKDFSALDNEYAGPEEEPPRLSSWSLTYYTTLTRKDVTVTNTQEPEAFRRMREKLETFATNELRIRGLQYSRGKLLEMARAAGDTGRMKWEDRDVEYGNVHASICAYGEAIAYLETLNPKPPEFAQYREAMERATKELDRRYKDQRFVVEQATSTGDWEKAKRELVTLCEMIPDREDARNHEATLKLIDVEKRLGKKGGRK